jgi:hypothetical protein
LFYLVYSKKNKNKTGVFNIKKINSTGLNYIFSKS